MSRLTRSEKEDLMAAECLAARANLKKKALSGKAWDIVSGEGGFDLTDGWARIFAFSKTGRLHMFSRTRIAEAWMAPLSSQAVEFEEMTKWPLSTLPKQNPFRTTWFTEVIVQAPTFDKGYGQYKVEFDCKPSLTFWFKPEMVKASGLDGWVLPRAQSATVPWRKERGIIKATVAPRCWVPKLTIEERKLLIAGDKGQVIRNLHKRHKDDLKNRVCCIMDIKEGVERLMEALA